MSRHIQEILEKIDGYSEVERFHQNYAAIIDNTTSEKIHENIYIMKSYTVGTLNTELMF